MAPSSLAALEVLRVYGSELFAQTDMTDEELPKLTAGLPRLRRFSVDMSTDRLTVTGLRRRWPSLPWPAEIMDEKTPLR
jgi:hypothetical protein